MEALFEDLKKSTISLLKSQQYYEKVGAFEDSGYLVNGYYGLEVDCIMFSCKRSEFY